MSPSFWLKINYSAGVSRNSHSLKQEELWGWIREEKQTDRSLAKAIPGNFRISVWAECWIPMYMERGFVVTSELWCQTQVMYPVMDPLPLSFNILTVEIVLQLSKSYSPFCFLSINFCCVHATRRLENVYRKIGICNLFSMNPLKMPSGIVGL